MIHMPIKVCICRMLFYIICNTTLFCPFLNTVSSREFDTFDFQLRVYPLETSTLWSWFCLKELYRICFSISNESHLYVKDKLMFIWVPNKMCYLELIIVLIEWLGQRFEWKLLKLFHLNYRAFKSSVPLCSIASAAVIFLLLSPSNFFK